MSGYNDQGNAGDANGQASVVGQWVQSVIKSWVKGGAYGNSDPDFSNLPELSQLQSSSSGPSYTHGPSDVDQPTDVAQPTDTSLDSVKSDYLKKVQEGQGGGSYNEVLTAPPADTTGSGYVEADRGATPTGAGGGGGTTQDTKTIEGGGFGSIFTPGTPTTEGGGGGQGGENHQPSANGDFIVGFVGLGQANLLNNDTDMDGDALKVTQVSYNGKTYDLNNDKVTVDVGAGGWFYVAVQPDGTVRGSVPGGIVKLNYKVDDNRGGTSESFFTVNSPVALDLNHNGKIDVTGQTGSYDKSGVTEVGKLVSFDMDGDGVCEKIEWLKGTGDALLIDNRDGLAVHDMDGSRLFGDDGGKYHDGYEKLAFYDVDQDGSLAGEELDGLNVWVDDGDAQVQSGELLTLDQLGIREISVSTVIGHDDQGRALIQGEAVTHSGDKILTEDVWFLKQEDGQGGFHGAHDLHVDPWA